jgi:hypothetical protein
MYFAMTAAMLGCCPTLELHIRVHERNFGMITVKQYLLSYGLSLFTGPTKRKVPFWSKIAESYAVCGTSGCTQPLKTQIVGEEYRVKL